MKVIFWLKSGTRTAGKFLTHICYFGGKWWIAGISQRLIYWSNIGILKRSNTSKLKSAAPTANNFDTYHIDTRILLVESRQIIVTCSSVFLSEKYVSDSSICVCLISRTGVGNLHEEGYIVGTRNPWLPLLCKTERKVIVRTHYCLKVTSDRIITGMAQNATLIPDHKSEKMNLVMWLEEHIRCVSVLQRVYSSISLTVISLQFNRSVGKVLDSRDDFFKKNSNFWKFSNYNFQCGVKLKDERILIYRFFSTPLNCNLWLQFVPFDEDTQSNQYITASCIY